MKTKYYLARIRIIDRELSKHNYVKTRDLVRIIKRELNINVTQRTIQKDMEDMQEDIPMGYAAPIAKDTKKKAYYYTDENFTIQAFGLKEEDLKALLFYAKTLDQFKGIKLFKDILHAIEKVVDKLIIGEKIKKLIANRTLIQTERIPIIKGLELIEPIMKAILENQKIIFDYTKFDQINSERRELSPILLKEDRHFWYVIGMVDDRAIPKTFALDRMNNLKITNNYFSPPHFNVENHFKYSFGVTVLETEPVEIVLSYSPFQGNYIKALPIHETQKIIKDNKDEFRISVKVIPSYEFYSKILSYGSDVNVISPHSIVNEVKQQLQAAFQNYK